jgi:hypothetical protein
MEERSGKDGDGAGCNEARGRTCAPIMFIIKFDMMSAATVTYRSVPVVKMFAQAVMQS